MQNSNRRSRPGFRLGTGGCIGAGGACRAGQQGWHWAAEALGSQAHSRWSGSPAGQALPSVGPARPLAATCSSPRPQELGGEPEGASLGWASPSPCRGTRRPAGRTAPRQDGSHNQVAREVFPVGLGGSPVWRPGRL